MSDITIRQLEFNDIKETILCCARYHKESEYKNIPFNNEKLADFFLATLNNPDYFFKVFEKENKIIGLFAAHLNTYIFSHSVLAEDLAWYLDKNERGSGNTAVKILSQYKQWAKERNAVEALIVTSSGITILRTAQLLNRLGFTQVGTAHKYRLHEV